MSENKFQQAELAALLGVIERLAGELSLAEEPARFTTALEDGAPAAGRTGAPGSPASSR
jgi:hypothetical protein